jgi:hypothetical protein
MIIFLLLLSLIGYASAYTLTGGAYASIQTYPVFNNFAPLDSTTAPVGLWGVPSELVSPSEIDASLPFGSYKDVWIESQGCSSFCYFKFETNMIGYVGLRSFVSETKAGFNGDSWFYCMFLSQFDFFYFRSVNTTGSSPLHKSDEQIQNPYKLMLGSFVTYIITYDTSFVRYYVLYNGNYVFTKAVMRANNDPMTLLHPYVQFGAVGIIRGIESGTWTGVLSTTTTPSPLLHQSIGLGEGTFDGNIAFNSAGGAVQYTGFGNIPLTKVGMTAISPTNVEIQSVRSFTLYSIAIQGCAYSTQVFFPYSFQLNVSSDGGNSYFMQSPIIYTNLTDFLSIFIYYLPVPITGTFFRLFNIVSPLGTTANLVCVRTELYGDIAADVVILDPSLGVSDSSIIPDSSFSVTPAAYGSAAYNARLTDPKGLIAVASPLTLIIDMLVPVLVTGIKFKCSTLNGVDVYTPNLNIFMASLDGSIYSTVGQYGTVMYLLSQSVSVIVNGGGGVYGRYFKFIVSGGYQAGVRLDMYGFNSTTRPTTPVPTIVTPTTVIPTTIIPTTVVLTTMTPTTVTPTTITPTTMPTTITPTTTTPTTITPTTTTPTTITPTTTIPTTVIPTTAVVIPTGNFDVFLAMGQSNMVGNGVYDPVLDAPNNRVFYYRGIYNDVQIIEHIGTMSLMATFGKLYAASSLLSIGRNVLLVDAAYVGSGFSTMQWVLNGPIYNDAVSWAQNAMLFGTGNQFKGFLWLQGETDIENHMGAYVYQSYLQSLILHLRYQINGAELAPFIAGEVGSYWLDIGLNTIYGRGVMGATHRLSKTMPNMCVPTSYGLDSNAHFEAPSLREYGKRFYDCYQSLVVSNPYPPTLYTSTYPSYASAVGISDVSIVPDSYMTSGSSFFSSGGIQCSPSRGRLGLNSPVCAFLYVVNQSNYLQVSFPVNKTISALAIEGGSASFSYYPIGFIFSYSIDNIVYVNISAVYINVTDVNIPLYSVLEYAVTARYFRWYAIGVNYVDFRVELYEYLDLSNYTTYTLTTPLQPTPSYAGIGIGTRDFIGIITNNNGVSLNSSGGFVTSNPMAFEIVSTLTYSIYYVAVRGCFVSGNWNALSGWGVEYFPSSFQFEYSSDNGNTFIKTGVVDTGLTDFSTIFYYSFPVPINGTIFRFTNVSSIQTNVCLRAELFGNPLYVTLDTSLGVSNSSIIPDSSFSSTSVNGALYPYLARLNNTSGYVSSKQTGDLTIDMLTPTVVTGLQIQCFLYHGYQITTSSFALMTSTDGFTYSNVGNYTTGLYAGTQSIQMQLNKGIGFYGRYFKFMITTQFVFSGLRLDMYGYTVIPTTVIPTTITPTTITQTTITPTTVTPSTITPSTITPTTITPTTVSPTTVTPTTITSSTITPTTTSPTTITLTTTTPTTIIPTTTTPSTISPTTVTITTITPTTVNPTTLTPTTLPQVTLPPVVKAASVVNVEFHVSLDTTGNLTLYAQSMKTVIAASMGVDLTQISGVEVSLTPFTLSSSRMHVASVGVVYVRFIFNSPPTATSTAGQIAASFIVAVSTPTSALVSNLALLSIVVDPTFVPSVTQTQVPPLVPLYATASNAHIIPLTDVFEVDIWVPNVIYTFPARYTYFTFGTSSILNATQSVCNTVGPTHAIPPLYTVVTDMVGLQAYFNQWVSQNHNLNFGLSSDPHAVILAQLYGPTSISFSSLVRSVTLDATSQFLIYTVSTNYITAGVVCSNVGVYQSTNNGWFDYFTLPIQIVQVTGSNVLLHQDLSYYIRHNWTSGVSVITQNDVNAVVSLIPHDVRSIDGGSCGAILQIKYLVISSYRIANIYSRNCFNDQVYAFTNPDCSTGVCYTSFTVRSACMPSFYVCNNRHDLYLDVIKSNVLSTVIPIMSPSVIVYDQRDYVISALQPITNAVTWNGNLVIVLGIQVPELISISNMNIYSVVINNQLTYDQLYPHFTYVPKCSVCHSLVNSSALDGFSISMPVLNSLLPSRSYSVVVYYTYTVWQTPSVNGTYTFSIIVDDTGKPLLNNTITVNTESTASNFNSLTFMLVFIAFLFVIASLSLYFFCTCKKTFNYSKV